MSNLERQRCTASEVQRRAPNDSQQTLLWLTIEKTNNYSISHAERGLRSRIEVVSNLKPFVACSGKHSDSPFLLAASWLPPARSLSDLFSKKENHKGTESILRDFYFWCNKLLFAVLCQEFSFYSNSDGMCSTTPLVGVVRSDHMLFSLWSLSRLEKKPAVIPTCKRHVEQNSFSIYWTCFLSLLAILNF